MKRAGIIMAAVGLALAIGMAALRSYAHVPPVWVVLVCEAVGVVGLILVWMRSRLADFREFVIILIILAAVAGMAVAAPGVLTTGNLSALLLAISVQAICAIGMTVLLVSGGFDLSVGSTVGLTGAVTALCMVVGLPVPVGVSLAWPCVEFAWYPLNPLAAILVGLSVGAAIGLANGLIIAKIGINAFITTLGMMGIGRGALEVITRGTNVYGLPASFKAIGQGDLAGIQYPIIVSLVLVIVGDIVLRKSRFFRQNYYIGAGERAAVLSGIPVDRMKIFNYALMGLLAAAAGVIITARFGSATTTTGLGLELQVISAVIIGGASLQGGEGTVLGSFLGCILMALIVTSLNVFGVDIYWQRLIIGATLLVAVLIDTLSKRRPSAA